MENDKLFVASELEVIESDELKKAVASELEAKASEDSDENKELFKKLLSEKT